MGPENQSKGQVIENNHIGADTDIRAIRKLLEVVDFQVNTIGEKNPKTVWIMAATGAANVYRSEGHNIIFDQYFKAPKLVNSLCLVASTDTSFLIGSLEPVLGRIILPGMKIPNPQEKAKEIVGMVNDWRKSTKQELFKRDAQDRQADVKTVMRAVYRFRQKAFGSSEAAMDPKKKLNSEQFDELIAHLSQEKEFLDFNFYATDLVRVYVETIKANPNTGEKLLKIDDILAATLITLGIIGDKNDTNLEGCMAAIRRQVQIKKGTTRFKETKSVINRLIKFIVSKPVASEAQKAVVKK